MRDPVVAAEAGAELNAGQAFQGRRARRRRPGRDAAAMLAGFAQVFVPMLAPVAVVGIIGCENGESIPTVLAVTQYIRKTGPGQYDLVVLEAEGTRIALAVDALIGEHQVVVKSLETNYRKVQGVAGATIMGDGRVALILDAPALVRMTRVRERAAA